MPNPNTAVDLVGFSLLMRPRKSYGPVYALHIVGDEDATQETLGTKMIAFA